MQKTELSLIGDWTSKKSESQIICKRINDDDEDDDIPEANLLKRKVWRKNNDVYFYDFIDDQSQFLLCRAIESAHAYLISRYAETIAKHGGLPEPINLHINSGGGYVTSSLAIYDFISHYAVPIVGIVEGTACSGATIILCGCYSRTMTPNSVILCHELRSGSFGKMSELRDFAFNNETLMKIIKKIYFKETKMPAHIMDDILSHDIYWDAQQCFRYGIVDYVIGDDIETKEVEEIVEERNRRAEAIEEAEFAEAKKEREAAKRAAKKAAGEKSKTTAKRKGKGTTDAASTGKQ